MKRQLLRTDLHRGAALALILACPVSAGAKAVETASFIPPEQPLVLTRELHKPLFDGKAIVSRRRYEIRFSREGAGYRVDGRLIDVEAPAMLAPLAALERSRLDEGLFPLYLDVHGVIVSQAGAHDPKSSTTAASTAKGVIASAPLTEADKLAASQMISQLQVQTQATGGNWPAELFCPATGRREESRAIALPDGVQGQVTVIVVASADSHNGLLGRLQRTVMTEIGGTTRSNDEIWTLAMTSGPAKPTAR